MLDSQRVLVLTVWRQQLNLVDLDQLHNKSSIMSPSDHVTLYNRLLNYHSTGRISLHLHVSVNEKH